MRSSRRIPKCERQKPSFVRRFPASIGCSSNTRSALPCRLYRRRWIVRTQAKLKLGYYPLSAAEARRIRHYLQFTDQEASVLDPCAGTGAAFQILTDGAVVRRYGVELDAYRAREARQVFNEIIHGSAFDA